MTTEPVSAISQAAGPLRGFDFTRAWLDEDDFVRSRLPASEHLLAERLKSLEPKTWEPWTEQEIQEVREFNIAAGNPGGAPLADGLGHADALVVITGQQPDFLAAPLYVLHKALSAVAWARKLSQELSRPVTPVFWVASDDDDFAELKQAWLLAWSGELSNAGSRLSRGDGITTGTPAFLWNLEESAPRLKEDITRLLDGWPGGDLTTQLLLQTIAEEPNFERCFCRLLSALLGSDYPMLFIAPRLQSMRRRGVSILQDDLVKHKNLNQAITAAADQFQKAGFPVALTREDVALNFFWFHEGRRHRLLRTSDHEISAIDPVSHAEARTFSEEELRLQLSRFPEQFIPNVVTRPVIQDTALPTAAYIAGPGEMAYLALLDTAYCEFGVTRSAVIPRSFITIEATPSEANASPAAGPADKAEDFLQASSDTGRALVDQITAMMTGVSTHLDQMTATASNAPPEVALALAKTRRHFQWGAEQLKRRLARQIAPAQWQRASRKSAAMYPGGSSQERVLAPWNFTKAGEWDALARHLMLHADFTKPGPHSVPLPSWLTEAL